MSGTSKSTKENLIKWKNSLNTDSPQISALMVQSFVSVCGITGKLSREEFKKSFLNLGYNKSEKDFNDNIGQLTGESEKKKGSSHSIRPFKYVKGNCFKENRYCIHEAIQKLLTEIGWEGIDKTVSNTRTLNEHISKDEAPDLMQNVHQKCGDFLCQSDEKNDENTTISIIKRLRLFDSEGRELQATVKIGKIKKKIGILVESSGGKGESMQNPHYSEAILLLLEILKRINIYAIDVYHAPSCGIKSNFINGCDINSIDYKYIAKRLREGGGSINGPIYISVGNNENIILEELIFASETIFLEDYIDKQKRGRRRGDSVNKTPNIHGKEDVNMHRREPFNFFSVPFIILMAVIVFLVIILTYFLKK